MADTAEVTAPEKIGQEIWAHPENPGSECYPANDADVKALKKQGFKKAGYGEKPPFVPHVAPKAPDEDKIAAIEKQLAELKAGR